MSEFELIRQFFTARQSPAPHVALGVGDDCALLQVGAGQQLAISTDMLVEGRHFFADAAPYLLGHKALAVNLSDLAAMGATPRAFTLALALPSVNPDWLREFSAGMLVLADQHGCQLIGGDTTRGPLTISITVMGEVPAGQALRRDAAQVGDDIWVTGSLGDANLALLGYLDQAVLTEDELARAAIRLHRPEPRVAAGMALRSLAHAAIDISDGLVGDLGHILQQSGVGGKVRCDDLPFGEVLANRDAALRYRCALSGGDDYELCFTAAQSSRARIQHAMTQTGGVATVIGQIVATPGLDLIDREGHSVDFALRAFDHFAP